VKVKVKGKVKGKVKVKGTRGPTRLMCPRCMGRVEECFSRGAGKQWYRVWVCLDCGWTRKRRCSNSEVPAYGSR